MDRCQDIEAAMKRHIARSDQTKNLEDLDGRTFGQLLGMFKPHCPEQDLIDWLQRLRVVRNDVAHKFFRQTKEIAQEIPVFEHFNHKYLIKGLRTTEICWVGSMRLEKSLHSQKPLEKASGGGELGERDKVDWLNSQASPPENCWKRTCRHLP
jgi:hypothetical protein